MQIQIAPRFRSRTVEQSGMAMLETVLVLPLLLLVLFGICELGLAFTRAQVLANAAREGAREASLFRPNCDSASVRSSAEAVVRENGARFGIEPAQIAITMDHVCVPAASVEVDVEYLHKLEVLSGLSHLVGGSLDVNLPLRARARMLNELRS
jgi:hypothetical protein